MILGALGWATAMAASAAVSLWMQRWGTPEKIGAIVALFAAGGAAAFPVAWILARLISGQRRSEPRFAAAILSLAAVTIGFTAIFYALLYRDYYSEWHAPVFSEIWMFQFVFTTLAAFYQFAVLGVRLYFPIGFAALFIAGVWMARGPR